MSVERTVRVNLVASNQAYNAAMAQSGAVTAATSAQVQGLGRNANGATKLIKKFGPGLLGLAGAKKAFSETAGATIEWESALTGVMKTVDGSPAQLAAIGDELRALSKELPTSAVELAAIAESAGQLGIETDNVLGFTRVIADLGETTNLVGQEGATALARFANITQMSQDNFDRLGSTVVDLGNNFATTEAEIAEMGLRLAGSGAVIGLTEAEILGIAAALTSVGINAEAGGTAFSKVFIDIANAAATGGEELDAFANVAGMTSQAFATMVEESPDQAIVALVEGLGAAADRGENLFEIIEGIGVTEIRMRDALLRSAGAGDLLSDALGSASSAWEENTALAAEAELRYGTMASKIETVGNRFKDAGRALGDEMTPALGEALDAANGLFDALDRPMNLGGSGDSTWIQALSSGAISGAQTALGLGGFGRGGGDEVDEEQLGRRQALRSEADRYVESLLGMNRAQNDVDGSAIDLSGALDEVSESAYRSADGVLELDRMLAELVGVHLNADAAAVSFARSMDGLGEAIAGGSDALDINTTKGQDNRDAMRDAASDLLGVIQTRYDEGASLQEVALLYDDLMGQYRDTAVEAGLTGDQVDELIATYGLTPEQVLTVIMAQDDASNIIGNVIRQLGRIPTLTTTEIRTNRTYSGSGGGNTFNHNGGMAGAGWKRYHNGGLAGDEIPSILQRGEYVVDRGTTAAAGGAAGIQRALADAMSGGGSSGPSFSYQQTFYGADASTMREAGHQARLAARRGAYGE